MKNTTLLEALDQIDAIEDLAIKDRNCLRLLTEEVFSMTGHLLNDSLCEVETKFAIGREGNAFELNLSVQANIGYEKREEFLALSSKKENVATKTIRGKIMSVIEDLLFSEDKVPSEMQYCMSFGRYYSVWSMASYLEDVEEDKEKAVWDGMEKSIIANFADDVVVGARGRQVDVIIKKTFN